MPHLVGTVKARALGVSRSVYAAWPALVHLPEASIGRIPATTVEAWDAFSQHRDHRHRVRPGSGAKYLFQSVCHASSCGVV